MRLATIDGAKALGLDHEIGSLEAGKRADIIIVRLDALHATPNAVDPVSQLVYSAQPADVQTVIVNGRLLMHDGELQTLDERTVIDEANRESALLMQRSGLAN